MNIDDSRKVYVVDTNVLVEFCHWCPFKFSSAFWSQLENFLDSGKWILLDVVVDEIKYPKEIKKWAQNQKDKGVVVALDEKVRERAVEINDQYPMIDEASGKSEVDTYIVAYAEINNLLIFTREGSRKDNHELYKIPDVCRELGVGYIRKAHLFMQDLEFSS